MESNVYILHDEFYINHVIFYPYILLNMLDVIIIQDERFINLKLEFNSNFR